LKDSFLLGKEIIPTSYILLLLKVVALKGYDPELVIVNSKIPYGVTTGQISHITIKLWSRAILTAIELTDDYSIGYEVGLHMQQTAHGIMGFAQMCAPNLEQALYVMTRFMPMRTRGYSLQLDNGSNSAVLKWDQRLPVIGLSGDSAQLLQRFLYESLMVGFITNIQSLVGHSLADLEMHVSWPCPNYHYKYESNLPPVYFDKGVNLVKFSLAELNSPISTANAAAYQEALEYCERERAIFDQTSEDILIRIKKLLILQPHVGYPTLTMMADSLNLSERTLKRKLQHLGMSFHLLQSEIAHRDAKEFLKTSNLSIQEISDLLGYSAPANFIRAFRNYSSITPGDFRKNLTTV